LETGVLTVQNGYSRVSCDNTTTVLKCNHTRWTRGSEGFRKGGYYIGGQERGKMPDFSVRRVY